LSVNDNDEDGLTFTVVVNHEEQYSLWPADRPIPLGWREGGYSGPRMDCLAHIEQVWQDMRPRSVREQMAVSSERLS
jgi:MbtH protein